MKSHTRIIRHGGYRLMPEASELTAMHLQWYEGYDADAVP